MLTSPMDGSPQVVRFDATTLWHVDAAEWAPSTASNAVFPFLALMLTDKKIAPHIPVIDKSKREDGTLRAVRDPLTSVLPPAQLSPGICRPCR